MIMETVQSFLTYHAYEGRGIGAARARRYLVEAIGDGLIIDAQCITEIDVEAETEIANATAARMAARMGDTL
jgi:hypothetical protein